VDAASSSASSSAENLTTLLRPRVPIFRWIWLSFALGAGLALVAVPLGELVRFADVQLVLNNTFFYTHQAELNAWINAIEALFAPVIALLVALVVALRGLTGSARRNAALRLVGALALLIALAWAQNPLTSALYRAQVGTGVQAAEAAAASPFLWAAAVLYGVPAFALGVALIVTLRLVAPRLMPASAPSRAGYGVLAGVLVGVSAAVFSLLDRFLIITILALRLAYVGDTGCEGGSGAGCYGGQLLDMGRGVALPLVIGAALGGLVGSLLILNLRAAGSAQAEGTDAGMASSAPVASSATAPSTPSRGWLARSASLGGAFLGGPLYAALVLFCVYHARNAPPAPPITAYLLLPALALLVPAGLLALAASSVSVRGGWALWAALLALAVGLAVGVPALLMVAPQVLGASAILLATFSFGAAAGLLAGRFAASSPARPVWRRGLRAAAVGWLGFSLVLGIWLRFQFHDLVIPGPTTFTCHGLGCGGLYLVAIFIVIGSGVKTLVLGLPAALLAGVLAGSLARAVRQPSHSGSGATPSASTMRL
jgi:hypothetical protein